MMDRGIDTFIQPGKQLLRRADGGVELTRREGLFVLPGKVVYRPTLMAPVHAEGAVQAPGRHPKVDREMETEEVAPPVAHEHPPLGKQSREKRRHHGLTHFPYKA